MSNENLKRDTAEADLALGFDASGSTGEELEYFGFKSWKSAVGGKVSELSKKALGFDDDGTIRIIPYNSEVLMKRVNGVLEKNIKTITAGKNEASLQRAYGEIDDFIASLPTNGGTNAAAAIELVFDQWVQEGKRGNVRFINFTDGKTNMAELKRVVKKVATNSSAGQFQIAFAFEREALEKDRNGKFTTESQEILDQLEYVNDGMSEELGIRDCMGVCYSILSVDSFQELLDIAFSG